MSPAFTPQRMNEDVFKHLSTEGYHLPDSWPFPARVAPDMNARAGWRVSTAGAAKSELVTVYTAPDGSQYTPISHGARTVLVGLSKRTGPVLLRILPGSRRPAWVIADTPKGEIPEHLKRYLLKPGQKLTKGEKRLAEELAVEPAVAVKGSRWVGLDVIQQLVKAELEKDPTVDFRSLLLRLRKQTGMTVGEQRTRRAYLHLTKQQSRPQTAAPQKTRKTARGAR